jgi:uncharacterized membrane protein YfcA
MIDMTGIAYALAATAVMIAGISKGGFGAGVGLLATPLMALVISPAEAVGIMLPLLILIDQVGMGSYWRKWSWAAVRPIIIFGAVGIGIGTMVFQYISADALRLGLGVIVILFTLLQLRLQYAQKRGETRRLAGGPISGAILGTATGFTSTMSHAGGPPVTAHLLSLNLDKLTYQASSVLIFWAINLMKVGPFIAIGVLDGVSLWRSLTLAPFAIIGVLIGVWAHKRVPQTLFFRVMIVALLVTGLTLVWDGAAGLL